MNRDKGIDISIQVKSHDINNTSKGRVLTNNEPVEDNTQMELFTEVIEETEPQLDLDFGFETTFDFGDDFGSF